MVGTSEFKTYRVSGGHRRMLVDFVADGLGAAGCRLIHKPSAGSAPFRLVIETPWGERLGVVMYLFRSTMVVTRNRPSDEARFQVKYGSESTELHPLFIDPYGLYITIFAGIDLEHGVIVSADPAMHNPTRFFISIEYKNQLTEETLRSGWSSWEREKRGGDEPIEILIACTRDRILDLLLFERAAQGLAPGHRQLLAEEFVEQSPASALVERQRALDPEGHKLLAELSVDVKALLDVIEGADRLKMAVRGWVAEHHLGARLRESTLVKEVATIPGDGQPDFAVTLRSGRMLRLECKNCLRVRTAACLPRVDFMRTRASKSDPCSRYYATADFEMLAACLHPVTKSWDFAFRLTDGMAAHRSCPGKLDNRVVVDGSWKHSFDEAVASLL